MSTENEGTQTIENQSATIDTPIESFKVPEMNEANVKRSDAAAPAIFDPNMKMDILNDVNIGVTIEIGRSQLKIRDLLSLTKGSIIELDKLAGDPVEVYANGKLISTGNIITANGKYCVRLTSIAESAKLGTVSNEK